MNKKTKQKIIERAARYAENRTNTRAARWSDLEDYERDLLINTARLTLEAVGFFELFKAADLAFRTTLRKDGCSALKPETYDKLQKALTKVQG